MHHDLPPKNDLFLPVHSAEHLFAHDMAEDAARRHQFKLLELMDNTATLSAWADQESVSFRRPLDELFTAELAMQALAWAASPFLADGEHCIIETMHRSPLLPLEEREVLSDARIETLSDGALSVRWRFAHPDGTLLGVAWGICRVLRYAA